MKEVVRCKPALKAQTVSRQTGSRMGGTVITGLGTEEGNKDTLGTWREAA